MDLKVDLDSDLGTDLSRLEHERHGDAEEEWSSRSTRGWTGDGVCDRDRERERAEDAFSSRGPFALGIAEVVWTGAQS